MYMQLDSLHIEEEIHLTHTDKQNINERVGLFDTAPSISYISV